MMSDTIKRHCKHDVKLTVDWQSFAPQHDKRIKDSNADPLWLLCGEPLKGLGRVCDRGHSDLVQQQVKTVLCRYNAGNPASLSLKDGALMVSVRPKTRAYRGWVDEQLGGAIRAGAFTVAQADFIQEQNADFKRRFGEGITRRCGVAIPWRIEWASFTAEIEARLAKQDDTSIYDACGLPYERLGDVCEAGKASKVKKKITAYVCSFGGPGKRGLKLKGGEVRYQLDFSAKKPYVFVDKFLVKKRIIKKRPKPRKMSAKQARALLRERVSPKQRCWRGCDRRCRHAGNRSRCKSRCRGGCR